MTDIATHYWTTSDGIQLAWREVGQGRPVILLHGGNLDRRMWDEQFELLRQHYRVIRYDARGYGRSSAAERTTKAHLPRRQVQVEPG